MEPSPQCPAPRSADRITLAHGGGGRLMHNLVRDVFATAFGSTPAHDGYVADFSGWRIATTTDGYVVRPMFFPGGDIGSLAVNGTVNDLAMCGARPISLAAGFIIEEGTEFETLHRIAKSMAAAATEACVKIVTGDTKVVERGKGDGVYITTSGVGVCERSLDIHPHSIVDGDVLILSSDVGRHGMAVMSAREGLSFESQLRSDCRSLWPSVKALIDAEIEVHCLRDLTRGGLATGLVELATSSELELVVEEDAIAVNDAVHAACEFLGLDPLYVANEGCFVSVIPERQAEAALEILEAIPGNENAKLAGRVQRGRPGQVSLKTRLGTLRNLHMQSGEQLPRIC